MKRPRLKQSQRPKTLRLGTVALTLLAAVSLTAVPAGAIASRSGAATAAANPAKTTSDAASQAKLKTIISKGDTEINRRLTTLNTLSGKITGAVKLSSADKNTLSAEVSDEVSGLTTLKNKLDADTDLDTARTDAQGIFTDYRVYALIVPKVQLVKTADDQQVAEGKLTTLAAKLQSRITDAQNAGKDVSSLQSTLSDLTGKTNAAQSISSGIETSVINLQPADYDSNHSVLSGDRDQLKTAQADIKTATADGQTVVNGLKNL